MNRRAAVLLFVIPLALAVAVPAHAQDSGKTAADHLAEAQAAVSDGRLIEADAAIAAGLLVEPTHLKLLSLRGEVRLTRRDFEGALEAYEAYLAAKPRGANRRKARKIIANLSAARTTQLVVKVAAGEARVYLDAKSLGVFCVANPECKKGLLPGRYRVIVEADGFDSQKQQIRMRLGKATELELNLVEKPSPVLVTVSPSDAKVTLDGNALELGKPVELPPGEHTVAATLDGFAATEKKITAARGKMIEVNLSLAERIAVSVNVDGATVTLDGTKVAPEGGVVLVPLDRKAHTIAATAPDHEPAEFVLAADRERGTKVDLELEPVAKTAPPNTIVINRTTRRAWTTQRKILVGVAAGVAAVGLGFGTVTGVRARSDWNDSKPECDDDGLCSQLGFDRAESAQDNATMSNVAFGLAGVAVTAAVLLWLTVPEVTTESPAAITPVVTPDQIGAAVSFGF